MSVINEWYNTEEKKVKLSLYQSRSIL